MNQIERFLRCCCREDYGAARVSASALYRCYLRWLADGGDRGETMERWDFGRAMTGAGFGRIKSDGRIFYLGLRLLEPGGAEPGGAERGEAEEDGWADEGGG